jgi:hypothetical protein
MTNKISVRVKFETPLGVYYGKLDEIPSGENSFQDYVVEVTSLIAGPGGVASFTNSEGDTVFLMSETLKNSIIVVEKIWEE